MNLKRLDDYLKEHTIVKIGSPVLNYVSCETIVDNPAELISIVLQNNCYISEIRWWDRVKITSGSIIGYGGPRDPRSPYSYFFAETDICKTFNIYAQEKEYSEYLSCIKNLYSKFDLFPAFDIKMR